MLEAATPHDPGRIRVQPPREEHAWLSQPGVKPAGPCIAASDPAPAGCNLAVASLQPCAAASLCDPGEIGRRDGAPRTSRRGHLL